MSINGKNGTWLLTTLRAFILEILWARKALAASFESSEDQVFVRIILSFGTQHSYTAASASIAACPAIKQWINKLKSTLNQDEGRHHLSPIYSELIRSSVVLKTSDKKANDDSEAINFWWRRTTNRRNTYIKVRLKSFLKKSVNEKLSIKQWGCCYHHYCIGESKVWTCAATAYPYRQAKIIDGHNSL